MEMLKLKPLTEDEKSLVRNYFATWDTGGLGKWRIWFMYWRMKALGESIPKADTILDGFASVRMDSYKQFKESEIAYWLRAYEDEHQISGEYEVMKINHRANGRTLVIGILDQKDRKVFHSHVIEIFESLNPEYFRQCIMKYAPNQALSHDKPF